jgi:hypothetical protein
LIKVQRKWPQTVRTAKQQAERNKKGFEKRKIAWPIRLILVCMPQGKSSKALHSHQQAWTAATAHKSLPDNTLLHARCQLHLFLLIASIASPSSPPERCRGPDLDMDGAKERRNRVE